MARTITIDGVDRTSIARLDSMNFGTTAFRGEVGTGTIVIDDPSAAITIDPLKAVTVVEDASTPSRIFTGYTAERRLERGPLRVADQRQWVITFEDLNILLDDLLLTGSAANRPEETDYQRVTWLLTQNAMTYYSITAGQVPKTNTKEMDKQDYRGAYARTLLEDCSTRTGKNFYIYDEGSGFLLYYDKQNAAATSPISVSDVLSDVNNTTVFAPYDVEVLKDPERKYDSIRLNYRGGSIRKGATPAGRRKEKAVTNKRIRTRAKARDHLDNLLDQTDAETVELSLSVGVPASVVGDIRAGQKINVKLSHAGITSYTLYRIKNVQIGPRGRRAGSDVEYEVALTMADKIRPTHVQDVGGPGGGGSSVPPDEKEPGVTTTDGTVDVTNYLMEDWSRTPPDANDGVVTTSSGTSHVIALPDGSDGEDRLLVIHWLHTGTDHTGNQLRDTYGFEYNPFTTVGSDVNTRSGQASKLIDGTEGFPSTGATITLTTSGSETLMAHVRLLDEMGGQDAPDNVQGSSTVGNDPGAINPTWDVGDQTEWMTFIVSDAAVSGEPTGYTNLGSGSSGGLFWRLSRKAGTGATEDPSAYTSAGDDSAMTFGLRHKDAIEGGGQSILGHTPTRDVTDATWPGSTRWDPVNTTVDDVHVTGSNLRIVSDATNLRAFFGLTNTDVQTLAFDGPWVPMLNGDWTATLDFEIDVLGTLDPFSRYFGFAYNIQNKEGRVLVRLGDNTYAEGVYVSDNGATEDFQAVTIDPSTQYRLKWEYSDSADTIKAKLWKVADTEPSAWQVSAPLAEEVDDDSITFQCILGNDGAPAMTLDIGDIYVRADGQPGQKILRMDVGTGDGTTTTFTITPFFSGSLTVWVAGIQTKPLSVDADAGTFTLDRAPANGMSIEAGWDLA
jgi:hypothetical protein